MYSRTRKPGAYEINETLRAVSHFFKSKRLLSLHKHNRPRLHKRERTNLKGEKETEAVREREGAEAVLVVDSTVPLHVTTLHESIRATATPTAKSQGSQRKTSVGCVIRKATIKTTVPCSNNSDLTMPRREIKVPLRQRKQGM